ncbi:MAG: sugar phosphate isomerase/epimerase family protein [Verrucomicrobiota bacterium]
MREINRREFIHDAALATAASGAALAGVLNAAAAPANRKMTIMLVCGAIGVSAKTQAEVNVLAHKHGFESVEARGEELARLSDGELQAVLADLKAKGLVWGAASLPVDYRGDEAKFKEGMKGFPGVAKGLERAGVKRLGTWLTPSSDSLTYLANFRQTARRLREVASVLKDHGIRFGLEYVGTQKSLVGRKYPFIHTLAETQDLIAEIGTGNVGLVLDSWHWWTAGDTEADLLAVKNEQIVSVDLNDAPAGKPREEQIDNQRELPMATGVINVGAFLNAIHRIGYDGPVRAEPFNKALNALDNDAACAATITAMKKAFALIQ